MGVVGVARMGSIWNLVSGLIGKLLLVMAHFGSGVICLMEEDGVVVVLLCYRRQCCWECGAF